MNPFIRPIVLAVLFSASVSFAAEPKPNPANLPKGDEIRCEKLIATSLADFKAALVENCNLNKPFSSSLSKVLSDEVYFYCCHKR